MKVKILHNYYNWFFFLVLKLKKVFSVIQISQVTFRYRECPLHGRSLFVRLDNSMLGVRCCVCGAAPIATSIATILQDKVPDFKNKKHYELSSRGAFFEFLRINVKDLIFSEYLDDVSAGDYKNGVQCQNVQSLTFDDSLFDVVTCTEVFEHVPDDISGFAEVFRVLCSSGVFIFTVPLFPVANTTTRAMLENNEIKYLLEPAYHDDSIRGAGKVLVFRDYGLDIIKRLSNAGFKDIEIINVPDSGGFGFNREVIIAYK